MNNKVSEIMALLQQIVDMVDNGSHPLFRSKQIALDENELISILDQLRLAIPEEVERANKVLADADNILNRAKVDAQNILTEAEEQANKIEEGAKAKEEMMLRDSEIVKNAEAVANELADRADETAKQRKAEADAYCVQTRTSTLEYLDNCLSYLDGELKRLNGEVQKLSGLIESAAANFYETRTNIAGEIAKQKNGAEEPSPE